MNLAHTSEDPRFDLLDNSLKKLRYVQDELIEVLHKAQDIFGYLSEDVLFYVARQLKLPPSRVYGVATFYHLFSFEAKGTHNCTVCLGTACYVKGSTDILASLEQNFQITIGETSEDRQLSLSSGRCLGSCSLAPVLVLDNEILGLETPETVVKKVKAKLQGAQYESH